MGGLDVKGPPPEQGSLMSIVPLCVVGDTVHPLTTSLVTRHMFDELQSLGFADSLSFVVSG
jgi:hypothetical protein